MNDLKRQVTRRKCTKVPAQEEWGSEVYQKLMKISDGVCREIRHGGDIWREVGNLRWPPGGPHERPHPRKGGQNGQ